MGGKATNMILIAAAVLLGLNAAVGFVGPKAMGRQAVPRAQVSAPITLPEGSKKTIDVIADVTESEMPFFGRPATSAPQNTEGGAQSTPAEQALRLVLYIYDYGDPSKSDAIVEEANTASDAAQNPGAQPWGGSPASPGPFGMPPGAGGGFGPRGQGRFGDPGRMSGQPLPSGPKTRLRIGQEIRGARVVEFRPEGVLLEQDGRQALLTCRPGRK